jgi:hypothetical protein
VDHLLRYLALFFQDRLDVPGPVQHPEYFDTVVRWSIENEVIWKPANPPGPDARYEKVIELARAAHARHGSELSERLLGRVVKPPTQGRAVSGQEVRYLIQVASRSGPNGDVSPSSHASLVFR